MTSASAIPSLVPSQTPLVILAEGCFGSSQSKFALGTIRYGQWPIAAVIDSSQKGQTVGDVIPVSCTAPIVESLEAALQYKPKALLIGTAPPGGVMPPEWLPILESALKQGLHLINGLHFFLNDEPPLVALAKQHHCRLWDVRDPRGYGTKAFQQINHLTPRSQAMRVITMVGSDCAVGKMHTALELHAKAQQSGWNSGFVATGQTGIVITGRGVPLDRVIGDFMAGALEEAIHIESDALEQSQPNQPQTLWIEGQGALYHPAYSGVTLSLLHGSNPDGLILCHKANQTHIRNYPQIQLPPITDIITAYETAAAWARPKDHLRAKVLGIAVNTVELDESSAQSYLKELQQETGLPTSDPVRYGVDALLDAVNQALPFA